MINPEQVPDEVVAAAREAWLRSDVSAKEDWRASIAAALNAWPGAAVCHYTIGDNEGYEMVLPLPFPQEGGDE